jgi:predicted hydrocarbon binding protein
MMNEKTQAAVIAMGVIGAKYVKRTAAHVYFEIPKSWGKEMATRAAKEFIRQTGIGVKFKLV